MGGCVVKATLQPLYHWEGNPLPIVQEAGSGRVRKISPPLGFDPQTVQSLEIRYTDYATILKNGVWKYGMGSSGSGQNTTTGCCE